MKNKLVSAAGALMIWNRAECMVLYFIEGISQKPGIEKKIDRKKYFLRGGKIKTCNEQQNSIRSGYQFNLASNC